LARVVTASSRRSDRNANPNVANGDHG